MHLMFAELCNHLDSRDISDSDDEHGDDENDVDIFQSALKGEDTSLPVVNPEQID